MNDQDKNLKIELSPEEKNQFEAIANAHRISPEQLALEIGEFYKSLRAINKIIFINYFSIVRSKSNAKHPKSLKDRALFEGVSEALEFADSKGFKIIAIANYAGVAAKHKTLKRAIAEFQFSLELAPQIESILFCPDFKGKECCRVYRDRAIAVTCQYPNLIGKYRLPDPGMLQHCLIADEANPQECWLIGSDRDKATAQLCGINFFWADIWKKEKGRSF